MQREFTEAEAASHNALAKRGWKLTEGRLILAGSEPRGQLGWFARRRLKAAVQCFEQALQIHPQGWQSMWALGKIHQRLGDHEASLQWFVRAHEINPTHPEVAREAGLAALDCGEAELAIRFCSEASDNDPGNGGLLANLALAHMLNGDDAQAVEFAERATRANEDDEISRTVLKFVQAVADGRRSRPKCLLDAFPH